MRRIERLLPIVLALAATAAIVQILSVCLYAFPHADDYVHIVDARDYPNRTPFAMSALVTWKIYLTSDSRWAATFINHLLIGSIDAYRQYPLAILAVAIVPLFGLFAFWSVLMEFDFAGALCAALILYGVLLAGYPSVRESVFWLNSAVQYSLGLAGACLLFAAIRKAPRNRVTTLLFLPAILFVGAFHEFTAFALLLIFGVIAWRQKTTGGADRKHWYCFLAFAFLGMVSIAFSPGNILRVQNQPLRTQHGVALAEFVLASPFISVPRWISDAPFVLAALVWMRKATELRIPSWLDNRTARVCVPALTGVLVILSVVAPPLFGGYRAYRAMDWGYFVLALGFVLSTTANREWLATELGTSSFFRRAAVIALTCSLVFSSNVQLARRGLSQPLQPWRQTMFNRIRFSSDGDVVLPYVVRPTPILNDSGVSNEGKDHWLNRAFAQFAHVRSVVAEAPCAGDTSSEVP